MFVTPDSHILFYLFIALVVGAGLFFSRSMGTSYTSYFFASKASGTVVTGMSLYSTLFISAVILFLPVIPEEGFSSIVSFVIIAAAVIPLFLAGARTFSAAHFYSSLGPGAKKFIGLHGLLFVAVVQILVLLRITDVLLSQFLNGTYFGIQVVMLVGAGIFTLIGGLNAVIHVGLITGTGAVTAFLFMIVNAAFLHHPNVISFHTLFAAGSGVFHTTGSVETAPVIAATGILFAMLWVILLEPGSFYRQTSVRSDSVKRKSIVAAASVFIVTVCGAILFPGFDASVETGFAQNDTITNSLVILGLFGGLMGMFSWAFQAAGVIIVKQFVGEKSESATEEKRMLIGRLAAVVTVILSILMVSFVKMAGNAVVEWYVAFLSFFSTPITSVFILSLVLKKGARVGVSTGLFAGELFAMAEFLLLNGTSDSMIMNSPSAFAFAIDIVIVTMFSGLAAAAIGETAVFKKFLMTAGFTRSANRM